MLSVRTVICAALGVLAVILLVALTPSHISKPRGIVLPASKDVYSSVPPENVHVYHSQPLEMSAAKTIGQVRAEVAIQDSASDAKNNLISYVKQLAGAAGANGVIVFEMVPGSGIQKAITFIGEAVLLPKQSNKTHGA